MHLPASTFYRPYLDAFALQGLVVAAKLIHKNRVGESSNRKLLESEVRIMTVRACADTTTPKLT